MNKLSVPKDFKSCILTLYEESKKAPSLYIKERNLSKAYKMKNIALAAEARGFAAEAGKIVCLMEKDIADSNPPIPKEETGRGHKKSGSTDGPLFHPSKLKNIRSAYKGLSTKDIIKKADEAIKRDEIPTRNMFIKAKQQAKGEIGGHRKIGLDSKKDELYTPPKIIKKARIVMGEIDLDPASDSEANKIVKAKKFFTKKDNTLKQSWNGKVWLNPPYLFGLTDQFIDKLIKEHSKNNMKQAIVLMNNNTETGWGQKLLGYANVVCFPKGRIAFWKSSKEAYKTGGLQGQLIAGINVNQKQFIKEFSTIGICLCKVK